MHVLTTGLATSYGVIGRFLNYIHLLQWSLTLLKSFISGFLLQFFSINQSILLVGAGVVYVPIVLTHMGNRKSVLHLRNHGLFLTQ